MKYYYNVCEVHFYSNPFQNKRSLTYVNRHNTYFKIVTCKPTQKEYKKKMIMKEVVIYCQKKKKKKRNNVSRVM